MTRKYLGALFILLTAIVFLFSFTKKVSADVNNFVVNNFSASYDLTNKNSEGSLHIVENLQVTFSDQNHGILRSIPLNYQGHKVKLHIIKVSSASGAPSNYSTEIQNGNLVLKIGNPSVLISGVQTYSIDYNVENVINFYNDHDEFYWDINGDQWQQSFEKVSANITVHKDSVIDKKCFTGRYGATNKDCTITAGAINSTSNTQQVSISTNNILASNQTLTAVLSLKKGVFKKHTFKDLIFLNISTFLQISLLPLFTFIFSYLIWRKYGKDIKGTGIIVPQYSAPDNLSPAEVATINSYKLSPKDLSATIIDLAIRKYLKITEITKKGLLTNTSTYRFDRLSSDISNLRPHEIIILHDIFDQNNSNSVELDTLKNQFYLTLQKLQKSIPDNLIKVGYIAKNSKTSGIYFHLVSVLFIIVAFVLRDWLSLGLVGSAIILSVFGILMNKRTKLGADTEDSVKGLKLYIEVAEADQIKMLQSPGSDYPQPANVPEKTVTLFEKLLPYAIVLGVEKHWAEKFQNIYVEPPQWFNGNWTTFNTIYLATSLMNSVNTMNTNFSPPQSSTSSGFSGGGFSGGGGGGGGGGGW